jgi:hypothetical protein
MIEKIRADLQGMFQLHGADVMLIKETNPVTNSLGEIIEVVPENIPQRIIERNRQHELTQTARGWSYQSLAEMAGDLSLGDLDFLLPHDTQIKEGNLMKYNGLLYHVKEITPCLVFGQAACFEARAERADANNADEFR